MKKRKKGEDVNLSGNLRFSGNIEIYHSQQESPYSCFCFDKDFVQNSTDADRHYDAGQYSFGEIPYRTFVEKGCILNQDALHHLMMAQPNNLIRKRDDSRFDDFVASLPGHWV